ncbi:hypothetical protein ACWEYY_00315 [Staphylococcus xylosus]
MKIKTKKQLNLPQLIEWSMENDVDNTIFIGKKNLYNVCFNKNGLMYFNTTSPIPTGEIFTVEVEEEITEDTEFKELICLDVDDKYNSYDNVCVLDFDDDRVRAIYIPNSDLTMTLIWRDGKLVE